MRAGLLGCAAGLWLAACGASAGGGGGGVYKADGSSLADALTPTDATAEETLGDATGNDAAGTDAAKSDGLLPGSLKTCTEVSQCAQDVCKTWTSTCGADCANAASSAASPTASTLLDCATQKCLLKTCSATPDQKCMDNCISTECPGQLVACWEQGAKPGSKGCSTVLDCLTGCDSDPKRFTCQANCYTALSSGAQGQFKAISTCSNANGGDTSKCVKESLTCLADGKSGSQSCYDVQACVGKCAKGDTGCQGKCYANGSAQAQTQLIALVNCVSGGAADQCLPQTITCASPSGKTGCIAMANCVTGCPTGDTQAACVMDCIHGGTPKAGQAFAKLAPCMQKKCANCGSDCQNCAIQNCFNEASACNSN